MKNSLFTAAVCLTMVVGSHARADLVVGFSSAAGSLTNVKHYSPGTSSLTYFGDIGNTATQVSVGSDLPMSPQGSTTLEPASGTALVSSTGSLMITFPNTVVVRGFSQNLDFTGNGSGSSENQGQDDVNITVSYTDGNGGNPSSTSTMLDFEDTGPNRYYVSTTNSEIITGVSVAWINGAEITSSKQIRVDSTIAAVPEPSSFACVGLVGVIGFVIPRGIRRWRNRK